MAKIQFHFDNSPLANKIYDFDTMSDLLDTVTVEGFGPISGLIKNPFPLFVALWGQPNEYWNCADFSKYLAEIPVHSARLARLGWEQVRKPQIARLVISLALFDELVSVNAPNEFVLALLAIAPADD